MYMQLSMLSIPPPLLSRSIDVTYLITDAVERSQYEDDRRQQPHLPRECYDVP
jgi:hypothetical protein